ncbi:MAG: HlyD family type I secretion periplasmic adaptor subunit [Hyphomicrobiaceae bacterium]
MQNMLDQIGAWYAALPLSREIQIFIAIELVLLVVVLLSVRALRRRRLTRESSIPGVRRRAVGAPADGLAGHFVAGFLAAIGLVGGVGMWAGHYEISGAIIAPGTVVADSNIKKVQHPTGGIVGEIRVREGDAVKVGDLLIKLDETQTRANLQIVTNLLAEMAVRQQRLMAERDGLPRSRLAATLAQKFQDPALAEMRAGELGVFDTRAKARAGQQAQLKERISQLLEEIAGLTAQRASKTREIDLLRKELSNVETLEAKQLVTINRMTQLRREEARIDGERGQLQASIAQARGRITEIELQILQIDNDLRTEVSKELREIQTKTAELSERRVAAEDQLTRVEIRSPQAGIVHQLAVHTVGGVITASEPVMMIVPEGDKLVVDARIAPQDRDQVHQSQQAFVRFPAFNQQTTPEVGARVQRIAADLTRETQTGVAYYLARLEISASEVERVGGMRLVAGMPAEVQMKTADRTALSYLLKPLTDQIHLAFRER